MYWDTAPLEDSTGGALGNTWHWVGTFTGDNSYGGGAWNSIYGTPLIWQTFDEWKGIDQGTTHGK
jgi:hypothetical protein